METTIMGYIGFKVLQHVDAFQRGTFGPFLQKQISFALAATEAMAEAQLRARTIHEGL